MTAWRLSRSHVPGASRAAVLTVTAFAATAAALVAAWPKLQPELERALNDAASADHWLLAAAAVSFAAVPLLSGALWREALRARVSDLGLTEACARYGIGTLLNSIAPARVGSVARVAAFTSVLPPGQRCQIVPALARIQVVRAVASVTTLVVAFLGLPPELLIASPLALRAPTLFALAFAVQTAKVGGVAAAAAALGVQEPLATAVLVTAALDLATLVSVTPAGAGIATAAATAALVSRGADSAVAAAIVVHGLETAAALSVGLASAAWLGARLLLRERLELVADPVARVDERVARRPAIDLVAKTPDKDVDRPVAVRLPAAPDLLEQLVA